MIDVPLVRSRNNTVSHYDIVTAVGRFSNDRAYRAYRLPLTVKTGNTASRVRELAPVFALRLGSTSGRPQTRPWPSYIQPGGKEGAGRNSGSNLGKVGKADEKN